MNKRNYDNNYRFIAIDICRTLRWSSSCWQNVNYNLLSVKKIINKKFISWFYFSLKLNIRYTIIVLCNDSRLYPQITSFIRLSVTSLSRFFSNLIFLSLAISVNMINNTLYYFYLYNYYVSIHKFTQRLRNVLHNNFSLKLKKSNNRILRPF